MNRTSHIPHPEFDFNVTHYTENNPVSELTLTKCRPRFNGQARRLYDHLMAAGNVTRKSAMNEMNILDPVRRLHNLMERGFKISHNKNEDDTYTWFCSPSDREFNEGVFIRLFGK
jgi:hypothetical protein